MPKLIMYKSVKPPLPEMKSAYETMAEVAESEERYEEASKLYHLAMKETANPKEMERLRRKSAFAFELHLQITDFT